MLYYVSSDVAPDTTNDGLSEDAPFGSLERIGEIALGPGDQVLLKRGSIFNDQALHIKEGSAGSADAPIRIAAYGEGADPVINANGQGQWLQDYNTCEIGGHRYRAVISTALLLKDVQYVEVEGLEITNSRELGNPDGLAYNDRDAMNRTGVAVIAENEGTLRHIVLTGLNIHDVTGNVYDKHLANGGIYAIAHYPKDSSRKESSIARFDDMRIVGNRLDTVGRWGIAVGYTAYLNELDADDYGDGTIADEAIARYGHTNVLIENNYVKDAGGDAITVMYCDRPLVQYNVAQGAARQVNDTDYCATDFGKVAAGIWPWRCKNALFQYNEVFRMRNGAHGNDDGQAWDADYGDGTLYQYNYSHGNTGGTVMFCMGKSVNNTFRYNIAQGDLKGAIDIPDNPDAHVYQNTFVIPEGGTIIRDNHVGGHAVVENNIFYNAQSGAVEGNWTQGDSPVVYSNNLYYHFADMPDDPDGIAVPQGVAVLRDPGSAPTAPDPSGVVREHGDPESVTVFDGYRPVAQGPAMGVAKRIVDRNGLAQDKDFLGNDAAAGNAVGAIVVP